MKDEIKEILDRLDFNEWEVDLYKVPIIWSEMYDIRDYITNLQEEVNKLTAESTEWESKYYEADNDRHKLFEQKEKAIEYINNLLKSDDIPLVDVILTTIKDLLNGGDEE